MKPLVVITTFGRLNETKATLDTLEASITKDGPIKLVIIDNGSGPEMEDYLRSRPWKLDDVYVNCLGQNVGCPKALNIALEHREQGQHVVKIDNDVETLTHGWVEKTADLIESYKEQGMQLGLISAMYENIFRGRGAVKAPSHNGHGVYSFSHAIGHALWHTGEFMDAVGHFDVLADDHLYGFEDNIMSVKAQALGIGICAWSGWQVKNIQRWSALGKKPVVSEHVEKMRPLYNARVARILSTGNVWTGPDGRPYARK